MKTYSNKSNATRAMNTYVKKVQANLISSEVDKKEDGFVVTFKMDSKTPSEVAEMLKEKFLVEVEVEVEEPKKAEPKATGKGLKIQKNREERNGIKRPSEGGKCAAVWNMCEEYTERTGMIPTPKALKPWAEEKGLNFNNVSIELYRWRNFMGYKGR